MKYPIIGKNDLVYSYKEQWFTGFAPCFQDNVFSLACCMGNKDNGGMRRSIFNHLSNTVWIVSIAGDQIKANEHNLTNQQYNPGDVIYIAKVASVLTLKDFRKEYPKRRDAIYKLQNKTIIRIPEGDDVHREEKNRLTDCTIDYPGLNDEDIYNTFEQIVIAEEYYILEAGQQKPIILDINRNFSFEKNGRDKRVKALSDFVKECKIAVVSKNPFPNMYETKARGCK